MFDLDSFYVDSKFVEEYKNILRSASDKFKEVKKVKRKKLHKPMSDYPVGPP